MYSLFYLYHKYGQPIMRPLSFEFPEDLEITIGKYDEEQFMLGPAFMIKPTRSEKLTEMPIYLPKAIWYDAFSLKSVESKGELIVLVDLIGVSVLIKGGSVVLTKERIRRSLEAT